MGTEGEFDEENEVGGSLLLSTTLTPHDRNKRSLENESIGLLDIILSSELRTKKKETLLGG